MVAVAAAPAQSLRDDFVFHVYVDPMFGDDALASQWNPAAPAALVNPLGPHPYADPFTTQPLIQGLLQHAPYPFRRLSGAQGALAYLNQVLPTLPQGNPGTPGVKHVVIHCLPGLYGPVDPPDLPTVDPVSGLPFNGEVFPIVIDRRRISLQGTSALDTIFDARGVATHILEVSRLAAGTANEREEFVDGITFRNATASAVPGSGAGIWIRGTFLPLSQVVLPVEVTITNCFFQGNAVGVAVDASAVNGPGFSAWATHSPILFNNTFAWNSIGLWQGNTGDPIIGYSHLSGVANNIFDLASPAGFPAAQSCFEGVTSAEREVTDRGTVSLVNPTTQQGRDFNAFADLRADPNNAPVLFNNGAVVGTWTVATPTALPEVTARVDLTGLSVQPRTLFVADALRLAPGGVPSEHDLRLCPNASADNSPTGIPSSARQNPCIDAGIDAGPGSSFTIRFRSGAFLCGGQLGLRSFGQHDPAPTSGCQTPADAEEAPISGWDFDAEGFGNPRIVPDLPEPTEGHFGYIDIGADEFDELIVAGFVNGTRIFSRDIPSGGPPQPSHMRIYFFGRVGTSKPRPLSNTVLGKHFPWFAHVQTPTDATNGNFTNVETWKPPLTITPAFRWVQVTGLGPYSGTVLRHEVPRNLECDISPHLVADFHPLWGTPLMQYPLPGSLGIDGYAVNPWFDSFPPISSNQNTIVDNQCLFHNKGLAPHDTFFKNQGLLPAETFVQSGHLNPPGTFLPAAPLNTWLLQTWGIGQFGGFGGCTGSTLQFGPWCFNDQPTGCPDRYPEFPGEAGLGRRFNLELPVPAEDARNVQTFLGIFPDVLPPAPPAGAGPASDLPAREMDSRLRRVTGQ